jgi:hypothetical protein
VSADTATATPRPTIRDFADGTPYSTRFVARFFGYTDQWVRNMVARKRLDGKKLDGRGPYLISGESVRALYGSLLLAEDAAGSPAAEVRVETAAAKALAKLAELDAKGGKVK